MSDDVHNQQGVPNEQPQGSAPDSGAPEPRGGGGGSPGPERRRSRSEGPGEPPPPNADGSAPNEQNLGPAAAAVEVDAVPPQPSSPPRPCLGAGPRRGRRLVKPQATPTLPLTAEQRLLLLDTWRRSGLPAGDFAALVGVSKHTLYAWKRTFDVHGPAGLMDKPRGQKPGSRVPDLTKRTILMLKEANPQWGCQRISDMLFRGPALPASPAAVARVLHEAGYELEENPTHPHDPPVRHFERARPNQLWQTDLFTFILKRQNRRVYPVAFMDDHSRFIVGYGLHASQSAALVLEVLRCSLTAYGTPEEILTDNGTQYVTWRGTSAFSKELQKRGIRQVVARPRHPQTLGKIERFWGSLWRECVEAAVFVDLEDARRRIGLFIDNYNFQRPHQGIDGLTPADRYFGAAEEVKRTLAARVAVNALELARQGLPKAPFYLTGQVGGQGFSVHAEGERVILTGAAGARREVELTPPPLPASTPSWPEPVCPGATMSSFAGEGLEEPSAPGASPLDEGLERLRQAAVDAGRRWRMSSSNGGQGESDSAARRRPKRTGGVRLASTRSAAARKQAAAILEVLAGARTPGQAAEALAVSLPRYYQLEQRALEGLLAACEPRVKGRGRSEASVSARLRRDNERLQRDLNRQQALMRLTQRNVGLPPPAPPSKPAGKKRRRRPVVRALAVAERLHDEQATVPAPIVEPTGV